ncbi:NIPSNAP family protein [Hydrogenophaga sp.]|uniref:NIPSNAP family protein n=1 Tax=Hydrogenophaga sp. TaxID=1904254 RepID=UPI0026267EFB|nr:NIPSNAP family protein [Hydrogenophaga sp.]MCW5653034.1 NIPSNAP family protein [Hydrogenophaga sp.]
MLVEERTYVIRPEYTPAQYLEIYASTGALELQQRVLGRMLGYFTTEIGTLNALVHLWGYDSFEERARRRALLAQEPAWHTYLDRIRPMLQSMENRLLQPTVFSPIR